MENKKKGSHVYALCFFSPKHVKVFPFYQTYIRYTNNVVFLFTTIVSYSISTKYISKINVISLRYENLHVLGHGDVTLDIKGGRRYRQCFCVLKT